MPIFTVRTKNDTGIFVKADNALQAKMSIVKLYKRPHVLNPLGRAIKIKDLIAVRGKIKYEFISGIPGKYKLVRR
jgi:hypothetical protein